MLVTTAVHLRMVLVLHSAKACGLNGIDDMSVTNELALKSADAL
jgi:hypothetical protein